MRKISLITLMLVFISLLGINSATAQEKKESKPYDLSLDLMSRYIWRGLDFGSAPSIQPGFTFEKSGFTFGAWGAYTIASGAQEADIFVSYTYKKTFSATITDYFFPNEVGAYKYFNYKADETGHLVEATLKFEGTKKLPLTALIAVNVWGADAKRHSSLGAVTGNQYSTYAELGYTFKSIDFFMGANLTDPKENRFETGFYGDEIGITNLGMTLSKDIPVTSKFSLPLQISLITNPQANKIYMVAGFSF